MTLDPLGSSARARVRGSDVEGQPRLGDVLRFIRSLVRGSDAVYALGVVLTERFIRACAGATPLRGVASHMVSVHPRVRGSDLNFAEKDARDIGSSARARERQSRSDMNRNLARFIRACAGATSRWFRRFHGSPVHPRVRGSDAAWSSPPPLPSGSSARARERRRPRRGCEVGAAVHPRVRGSDTHGAVKGAIYGRFIRACAGATA